MQTVRNDMAVQNDPDGIVRESSVSGNKNTGKAGDVRSTRDVSAVFTIRGRDKKVRGTENYTRNPEDGTKTAQRDSDRSSSAAADAERTTLRAAVRFLDASDIEAMQDEGSHPKMLTKDDFVTFSDKVRAGRASAGKDISMIGGLDRGTAETLTGSAAAAAGIESDIQKADREAADMPENPEADAAAEKAGEIAGRVSDGIPAGAAEYLVRNNLEPTAGNLYRAVFATGADDGGSLQDAVQALAETDGGRRAQTKETDAASPEISDAMLAERIEKEGLTSDSSRIAEARWLLQADLPIEQRSLVLTDALLQGSVVTDPAGLSAAFASAAAAGKAPDDAYLVTGFSPEERAGHGAAVLTAADAGTADALSRQGKMLTIRNLAEEERRAGNPSAAADKTGDASAIDAALSDTGDRPAAAGAPAVDAQPGTAADDSRIALYRKTLAAAQLVLAQDSLLTAEKLGVDIDTEDLQRLTALLTPSSEDEAAAQETADVLQKASDITAAPAAVLGRFDQIRTVSLSAVWAESQRLAVLSDGPHLLRSAAAQTENTALSSGEQQNPAGTGRTDVFRRMNALYEAVGTEARPDLGDSIRKAFRNVDELLSENGFEKTDENERAVRILGYNQMEVTPENILRVRDADTFTRQTLDKLKPQAVLSMIRDGENPLQMTMQELSDDLDQRNDSADGSTPEEKYAEFLYRAEKSDSITPAERESYIGIYRLVHQVNATDGAVIGQLLQQGTDLTMQNLITAVRTRKAEGQDIRIDQDFGLTDTLRAHGKSITAQIETAYQTSALKHAEAVMTPAGLKASGAAEDFYGLTPASFDERVTQAERLPEVQQENEVLDHALAAGEADSIRQAADANSQVYAALLSQNLPLTPANLLAMQAFAGNRNVFSELASKKHVNRDGSSYEVQDPDIAAMIENVLEDYGEAVKTPEDMAEAQKKLYDIAENVMRTAITEDADGSLDIRSMHLINKQLSLFSESAEKNEIYHIPILVEGETGTMTLKIVRGKERKGMVDLAFSTPHLGDVTAHIATEDKGAEAEVSCSTRATAQILRRYGDLLSAAMAEESGLPVQMRFSWDESTDVFAIERTPAGDGDRTDDVETGRLYGLARAFIAGLGRISEEEG